MINKIIRYIITVIGIALGVATYFYLESILPDYIPQYGVLGVISAVASGMVLGLIFYLLSPWILREGKDLANNIEKEVSKVPGTEILTGTIGLILGLFIAYFISGLIMQILPLKIISGAISALLYIFLGYIGMNIARRNREDLFGVFTLFKSSAQKGEKAANKKSQKMMPKVLDTSVIIDGRIADIAKTGFVEGKLIVPSFVLEELRHIADSSDDLKRVRGRRGLDILNMMQQEMGLDVEISEVNFEEVQEVDMKLLKLAQKIDGKVVTNDYNLNKVAQFQGVQVLNINELANAVKPLVIPGEDMTIQVVKEGKEQNQGIAYLDDGTMIVVEGGRKLIGETINVVVTSVLQTAAGRMIFAKPK